MNLDEMNSRQRKAYKNALNACNWLIGELENTLSDYDKNSDEYKYAIELLNKHDDLVNELYDMATSKIYDNGMCMFGDSVNKNIRDINFCGKEWLMQMCEGVITGERY